MANDDSGVPVGRLGRFVKLAGVGARAAGDMLAKKGSEKVAERAAEVLGNLRGLAAKLGQTASYVDGFVPETHRAVYEKALGALRTATPHSSTESIRALVEEELSAPIEKLFATWSDEPFASASIGQVHRAQLPNGQEVAVKVQHPGIDRAIESDLSNVSFLEGFIGAVGPKSLNSGAVLEEVKTRFREELDYRLEADRQDQFRDLHANDPLISIPRVVRERSARRVLTMDLVKGATLEEAALASPELRRTYAETLWRFVFKGNLVGGMFNADPHPGNYLFQPDGSIIFLDFGCIQPIAGNRIEAARDLHRAALRKDDPAFRRAAAIILESKGGTYEEAATAYSRKCFEPVFASPFRITQAFATSLVHDIKTVKEQIWAKDKSFVQLPSGMLFMNRLQFGFYSVLARLDVEVDYAEVERRFLAEAGLS
ncbi:MAG TPA: AarF/ABC1/UbiB kinase family protein [Polyangiaceae bacterium]|nr:AarF/ABC1/UbiB kinase family protein [Polyangiaceae bacterium]